MHACARTRRPVLKRFTRESGGPSGRSFNFPVGWGGAVFNQLSGKAVCFPTLGGFFKSVNRILKIRVIAKEEKLGFERSRPLRCWLRDPGEPEISPGSGEAEGWGGRPFGAARQS